MGALEGKVALITGSTSGIRARTAEVFVANATKRKHSTGQPSDRFAVHPVIGAIGLVRPGKGLKLVVSPAPGNDGSHSHKLSRIIRRESKGSLPVPNTHDDLAHSHTGFRNLAGPIPTPGLPTTSAE